MFRGAVIGFLAALVILAVGAYCYFALGLAPVASASNPMPFEKFLAKRALHAAIAKGYRDRILQRASHDQRPGDLRVPETPSTMTRVTEAVM